MTNIYNLTGQEDGLGHKITLLLNNNRYNLVMGYGKKSQKFKDPRKNGHPPKVKKNTTSKLKGNINKEVQQSVRPKNFNTAFKRYDDLLQQLIKARKKYFELFGRVGTKEKTDLKNKYYKTLDQLRTYEQSLPDWQVSQLNQKLDPCKEDLTYSEQNTSERLVPPQEHEDPHQMIAQKKRESFSDDSQESIGSMEDYNKFKGI